MKQHYLAARGQTLNGRKVWGPMGDQPGEPIPNECVTRTLIALAWIVPCSKDEYDAACAVHGRPPEKLTIGWNYDKRGVPKATKKKATKKKATKKATKKKKGTKKKASRRTTAKRS